MTTAIALARSDVPDTVPEMMQVAQFLQHSTMMPPHLQGEPASLFAVMLKARALNIPMATAFDNIIVQDGKTGLTATLMQALVIRAGYGLYLAHQDDTQATVRAERAGIGPVKEGEALVTFALKDAEQAQLLKIVNGKVTARSFKGNAMSWEKWTKDMLVWRAISRAARYYFSDVLMGMVYTPDEIGAEVDGEGMPVRVDAVRVDVLDEDVKKTLLRIRGTTTVTALKALYKELGTANMLSEIGPDGLTLSQTIANRKDQLQNVNASKRAKRTKPPADAEQAPPDAPPEECSTPVVSDPPAENPESDFDTLAPVAAEQAPPDTDTENTPRRDAVLTIAADHFGGAGSALVATIAHFGRELSAVGTGDLQQWLATLKASN